MQEVVFHETAVHVAHACLDVSTELELVSVPDISTVRSFSHPIVDILEKVPVNGTEMIQVKAPYVPGR